MEGPEGVRRRSVRGEESKRKGVRKGSEEGEERAGEAQHGVRKR